MTYDLLIKRIDTAKHSRLGELVIRTEVLRKVVELHQPIEIPKKLESEIVCGGCSQIQYEDWPCPTYKLIEEGMK